MAKTLVSFPPVARGDVILQARGISVGFGDVTIIENLDIDLRAGEVLGVVGASGTGKSVLLRSIIGLLPRRSGSVKVYDIDYDSASSDERSAVDRNWGVLFQNGALFSALTVKQNIQVPMREHLKMPQTLMDELAKIKIEMVGLSPDAADKYPSELSGGMIKRASLARALALDPDIVFLDEPTSGLDPISAAEFDSLLKKLCSTLQLSAFMVTHDLDSLYAACDRIAVIGQKRVLVEGSLTDMLAFDDPWVQDYFKGKRARRLIDAVNV
ncbi:MAG: ABC transporter ATP-binding protein [Hyphomicrobiales bacterium]|nr:MAG: ABC transporter ATP-binding protein [Hyphomicrobiales bacterium]